MSPTPLVLHCTERDGVTILQAGGALVEGNTVTLERRAALLLSRIRHPLILDVSQVGECDLAGSAVLVGVSQAALPATPVRLAGVTDAIEHVLRLAGVLSMVPTFVTVAGAIRLDLMEQLQP